MTETVKRNGDLLSKLVLVLLGIGVTLLGFLFDSSLEVQQRLVRIETQMEYVLGVTDSIKDHDQRLVRLEARSARMN